MEFIVGFYAISQSREKDVAAAERAGLLSPVGR